LPFLFPKTARVYPQRNISHLEKTKRRFSGFFLQRDLHHLVFWRKAEENMMRGPCCAQGIRATDMSKPGKESSVKTTAPGKRGV
jgi:hypothetical protein